MSAQEIIAELSKLDRKDLERVYAQLHEVLATVNSDGESEAAKEPRDATPGASCRSAPPGLHC